MIVDREVKFNNNLPAVPVIRVIGHNGHRRPSENSLSDRPNSNSVHTIANDSHDTAPGGLRVVRPTAPDLGGDRDIKGVTRHPRL